MNMDKEIDKASFNDLKEFFLSWGLWPRNEPTNDLSLGDADGEYIINTRCYERMCAMALHEYGAHFRAFVQQSVDAINGEFYMIAELWDDVFDRWQEACAKEEAS
jgi:hypothetical protein